MLYFKTKAEKVVCQKLCQKSEMLRLDWSGKLESKQGFEKIRKGGFNLDATFWENLFEMKDFSSTVNSCTVLKKFLSKKIEIIFVSVV